MYRDGVDGHDKAQVKVRLSQAKQFQNSVLLRSFHNRQNFCLPRACIDVRLMSEKKKMKSYLVGCLSRRSTLKKNCAKKVSLKKNH